MAGSSSTLPVPPDDRPHPVDRVLHILLVVVMVAVVVLGIGGRLGVTTEEASQSEGDMVLSVRYASVTRPGLSSPFVVTLTGASLPTSLQVEVDTAYVAAFDLNALNPTPASSWSDGERERWTFELPPGLTRFSVSADARLDPSVQNSLTADVVVGIPGGTRLAVPVHTRVVP